MKKNPTLYILMASAGHGKDYVKELIENELDKKSIEIKFAEKAKEIIATSLKSKFINSDMSLEDKIDKLNDLKDNQMSTKVLGNENMRKMLQVILGDVIRTVNPNIHALFALKKIEENLENDENSFFICTDNRYINEQEFIYPINLLSTNEEKIDYIRWTINEYQTTKDSNEILELFDKLTKPYIKDSSDESMLNKIKMKFINENNKLKETKNAKLDYYEFIKSINFDKIKEMSQKEGFEKGLINVFRPLLEENESYKSLNKEELKNKIKEFNNISEEKLNEIESNYNQFDIEFNYENIKKYGFLRANPNHPSERELDNRKPEALINYPEYHSLSIKNKISSFFEKEKQEKKIKRKNKIH